MRWKSPVVPAVAALLWVMASGARADDPGVVSIQVTVGESTPVGPGPVRNLVCDDGSLVQLIDTSNGPALKGLRAGTTLCSLTDVYSARRVYRVVVVAPPPARPLAPQGGAPSPGYGG